MTNTHCLGLTLDLSSLPLSGLFIVWSCYSGSDSLEHFFLCYCFILLFLSLAVFLFCFVLNISLLHVLSQGDNVSM